MTAVSKSGVALAAIAKSTWSVTKNFIIKMNTKLAYITNAFSAVTADSAHFTQTGSYFEDSVSSLNSHGTASAAANCIIFTATGYWSASSQSVNVICNGTTVVANSKFRNTQQPKSVSINNVGAFSIPVTTWSENSDGAASIVLYKAK